MDKAAPEEFLSPRTPPSRNIGDPDYDSVLLEGGENGDNSASKSRRKHRRAKGKKRKQKSSLMITNEDGSNFNAGNLPTKQSKINLRPTHNPLINAPRNSTQFIIDDHENSNLFWNFEAGAPQVNDLGEQEEGGGAPHPAGQLVREHDNERYSPDDDSFWTEYSERDFEDVYETAHQEEIFGWEKDRIVREITAMEKRHNQLIEMLAAIDPVIYLEKLQDELLSLQEVNRELKLVNIAEQLHRRENLDREGQVDSDSDSRLPDSTSQEGEGGCSSGCCLLRPCDENCDLAEQDQRLAELDQEGPDPADVSHTGPDQVPVSAEQSPVISDKSPAAVEKPPGQIEQDSADCLTLQAGQQAKIEQEEGLTSQSLGSDQTVSKMSTQEKSPNCGSEVKRTDLFPKDE